MTSYTYNKVINQNKLLAEIKASDISYQPLSLSYSSGVCIIFFQNPLSGSDEGILQTLIAAHDPTDMTNIVTCKIRDAMDFGRTLMIQFSVQNVLMGITQAGKTREVIDYLCNVKNAIDTGSLYVALEEIDYLLSQTIPPELSPFITAQRLSDFRFQIQDYLTNG